MITWNSNASLLHAHEREAIEHAAEGSERVHLGEVTIDQERNLWLQAHAHQQGMHSEILLGHYDEDHHERPKAS